MSDTLLWLQLVQLPLTRLQKRKLIERFGSVSTLFNNDEAWQFVTDYCRKHERPLLAKEEYCARADQIAEQCEQFGWQILTKEHPEFPERLRTIPDPPLLLFACGDPMAVSEPQIALVGSRKATPLGIKVAERFAKHLSDWGVGVVSGLALGIDSAAHLGALQGPTATTAVLANGPGKIYPHRNRALAKRLVEQGGLLLTENPPAASLDAWRFPERNRLIAGLALGTLVVEADLKSGSLVTARLALSQGAEVFAVPGALSNPQARGCHQLIKQGAVLVESPDDIINVLHQPLRQLCSGSDDSDTSSSTKVAASVKDPILRLLSSEDLSFDELIEMSGLDVAQLQVELAKHELTGKLVRRAGRYFCSS